MKRSLGMTGLVFVAAWALAPSALAGPLEDGVAVDEQGDSADPLHLWRPFAEQGHAAAQWYLGYMYANGGGVAEDDAEAARWFHLAAEQGHVRAQFWLGNMYAKGDGVPQDDAEAVKWYRLAAEQGDAEAQDQLERLSSLNAVEPGIEAIDDTPAGAAPGADETRVALVIGNSTYANVSHLPNTANDASDVAAMLERLGFEVTLVQDLDRLAAADALLGFGDKARDAEIAVVFYAGHGIELEGENYLVPVDAELRTDRHIPLETISLREVIKSVERATRLGLVMLDACRDNPFGTEMEVAGTYRSLGRGLARVEPEGGNVLVAYAAKEGTVAADGDGRNSPFTTALLEHLDDPGIDVRLMFGRVRDAVMRLTDRQQQPFTSGSLGGEEIVLAID